MVYCPSCALGLPMHPSFIYEILFHLAAFLILIRFGDRAPRPGDSFKLYLLAYALFRLGVEFVRDNPEVAWGLSGSQIFLLGTLPVGAAYLVWRRGVKGRVPMEVAT